MITDTAEFHYLAWKKLTEELGLPFDRDINRRLKGVGRMDSLGIIIENAGLEISAEHRTKLAERKNIFYREYLEQVTPKDLLPGIGELLKELKTAGVKTAVASASKIAGYVLSKLGAKAMFDAVVDGTMISVGKPDPEVFLLAAERISVPRRNCAAVEDAQAGIDAINEAGMVSVGIGTYLKNAGLTITGTGDLSLASLQGLF